MTKYQCPICSKRACDSNKPLSLAKLSQSNENEADIIIKCQCCKNTIAINVTQEMFTMEYMSPHKETTS